MTPPGLNPHYANRPRILFYHKHQPYYGFTNFSPHAIIYEGLRFPTSEHLFQSFKFHKHRPDISEEIRTCSENPRVAFSRARSLNGLVRRDWKLVHVRKMDEVLWHKFNQHLDLQAELLATGNAELVEDSKDDAFWGIGPDGLGRNELGKALERLRATFRSQRAPTRQKIYFCSENRPYFGFTTFSPHPVKYDGKLYPTAEHLFQSLKFHPMSNTAELLRTYPGGPREVKAIAQQFKGEVRHDWFKINKGVMEMILQAKFAQYADLADELRKTGKTKLIFDSSDKFWGAGSDASGRNELGRLLEKIRSQLYGSTM